MTYVSQNMLKQETTLTSWSNQFSVGKFLWPLQWGEKLIGIASLNNEAKNTIEYVFDICHTNTSMFEDF